jgi:hypothetical protein
LQFLGNNSKTVNNQAKFGLNWPSGFRGEDFLKSLQTDAGRRMPSDGNSSPDPLGFGSGELKM